MSKQRRILWFFCFVALSFTFVMPVAPAYAQTAFNEEDRAIPAAAANYPPDLPSDIDWSGSPDSWDGTMASFNNARVQESRMLGISLPPFVFPDFDSWQAMSSGEKTLWFVNEERTARGLEPMQGLEENVTAVAQAYAEWMLTNNKFGHDADGGNPWDRMYANPAIGACHDFIGIGENLQYHATNGPDPVPFVIEKSVYMMMYMDSSSEWGHRHAFLWTPYTENSGDPHREGFLGVGHAHGSFTSPTNGRFYQNADMIVMDFFDPCANWDEIVQSTPPLTLQPTPSATPSPPPVGAQPTLPTPTPLPTLSPTPTALLRQQSRTVSGRVTISGGDSVDQTADQTADNSSSGLAGVTIISNNGQRTQSDENGRFTLEGLSPGSYTLTPSKEDYAFSPSSIKVDLRAHDLNGVSFTGSSGPAGTSTDVSLLLPLISSLR
jgi:uncharacterized protein YkwD